MFFDSETAKRTVLGDDSALVVVAAVLDVLVATGAVGANWTVLGDDSSLEVAGVVVVVETAGKEKRIDLEKNCFGRTGAIVGTAAEKSVVAVWKALGRSVPTVWRAFGSNDLRVPAAWATQTASNDSKARFHCDW